MPRFSVRVELDYISGYVRDAHLEGEIVAGTEEEAKEKCIGIGFNNLSLVIDDVRCEDWEADEDSFEAYEI